MGAVEDINQWREGNISLNTYTAEPPVQAEVLYYPAGKDDS